MKKKSPAKASKVKSVLLAIGIALLLVFFVGYAINAIYYPPEREDYCSELFPKPFNTNERCEAENGTWIEPEMPGEKTVLVCDEMEDGKFICQAESSDLERRGYCEIERRSRPCENKFRDDMDNYNKVVFIIAVTLGLISIFLGAVVINIGSVSAGIMGGGVLTVIYGVLRYWGNAQDWLRVIILGAALFSLIWLGYKKLNPKK